MVGARVLSYPGSPWISLLYSEETGNVVGFRRSYGSRGPLAARLHLEFPSGLTGNLESVSVKTHGPSP